MDEAPLSSSSYDDDNFFGDDVWSLSLQEDVFSRHDTWPSNEWESPIRQAVPDPDLTHSPAPAQRNGFTTSATAGPSQHHHFHHTRPPSIRAPVHSLGLHHFPPSVPQPSVNNLQANQHDPPPPSPTSKHSDASRLSWNVVSSGDESDNLSEKSDAGNTALQDSTTSHHTRSRSLPQDGGDFVDLTGETPPRLGMAPATEERASKRRRLSGNESSQTLQPRKKNRSNNSSQNDTIPAVEEVDLRDVDDDKGLSKVLEDQRMATIKAQQEQAAIPVKLATLSCIICMDAMKDVTATSCGTFGKDAWPFSKIITFVTSIRIIFPCHFIATNELSIRPPLLSFLFNGGLDSRRKPGLRARQRLLKVPSLSQEGEKTDGKQEGCWPGCLT